MNLEHKPIIIGAVALVVGLGLGYFGSHAFAKSATASRTSAFTARAGGAAGFTRGAQMGGGLLTGTVASKSATSITIDTRDGSSHIVLISPDTSVSKSVAGSLDDVATGSTIIVSGTTNSDGSVSANLIQLRPAMPTGTVAK